MDGTAMSKTTSGKNESRKYPRVDLTPANGVPSAAGANLRASERPAFDIRVGVATDHKLFVGLTQNISAGGLFIATEAPLKRGDKVQVRFSVPGSNYVFDKQATVCWTRPVDADGGDSRTHAGAGVKFENLSDEEQKILNAFLQVHDAIFFEH